MIGQDSIQMIIDLDNASLSVGICFGIFIGLAIGIYLMRKKGSLSGEKKNERMDN